MKWFSISIVQIPSCALFRPVRHPGYDGEFMGIWWFWFLGIKNTSASKKFNLENNNKEHKKYTIREWIVICISNTNTQILRIDLLLMDYQEHPDVHIWFTVSTELSTFLLGYQMHSFLWIHYLRLTCEINIKFSAYSWLTMSSVAIQYLHHSFFHMHFWVFFRFKPFRVLYSISMRISLRIL